MPIDALDRDTIDHTLEQLITERLIDDQALADHLAWSLQESKKLGPAAIKQQLMRRRLPARVIDEALDKLQPADESVIEDIVRDRLRVLGDESRTVQGSPLGRVSGSSRLPRICDLSNNRAGVRRVVLPCPALPRLVHWQQ